MDLGEKAKGAPGEGEPRGRRPGRTGRNLPVAAAMGVAMAGTALLTLFTVKATFLVYMAGAVALALWELDHALRPREIRVPLVPVAVGGAATWVCAYWFGGRPALAALVLAAVAVLAWRLPGGAVGYLRDVTAGIFALAYLPLMAAFVALMLAAPDGTKRCLTYVILTVASDIGGYFAGILFGKHQLAPVISPKKTWEGLGGSALACLTAGMILLPVLLGGHLWQGVIAGGAALGAATLGDLIESMIKRDLGIKDMGSVLPGHGGVLDRIDSLLLNAPVVWLVLLIFIPVGGGS